MKRDLDYKGGPLQLNGATYEEIARAGGGIVNTVSAVRNATESALFDQSAGRLKAMLARVFSGKGTGIGSNSENSLQR